jgi:phosphoribosyl-ATP pyrophosphohydrolase/phosphoribosyl-AMP cyclohydrolase
VGTVKERLIREKIPIRPVEVGLPVDSKKNRNVQCVVPCIDIMGGHAVQLVGGKPGGFLCLGGFVCLTVVFAENLQIDAGDPVGIMNKFKIGGEIAIVDLDAAISGGSKNNVGAIEKLLKLGRCRVGGGIRDVETAKDWLNKGAHKIVIGSAASEEFLKQLPRDRVVVALDCVKGEVVIHGWKTFTGISVLDKMKALMPFCGHFLVTMVESEGKMQGFSKQLVSDIVALLDGKSLLTVAGGVTTQEDVR